MNAARSGNYPIERRRGEIDRLATQASALAADTDILLERIGVAPGWACLDLGCGPGGIVERDAPIHISNVMLFNSAAGKGDRDGVKVLENGKRVRTFRSSNEAIDA